MIFTDSRRPSTANAFLKQASGFSLDIVSFNLCYFYAFSEIFLKISASDVFRAKRDDPIYTVSQGNINHLFAFIFSFIVTRRLFCRILGPLLLLL